MIFVLGKKSIITFIFLIVLINSGFFSLRNYKPKEPEERQISVNRQIPLFNFLKKPEKNQCVPEKKLSEMVFENGKPQTLLRQFYPTYKGTLQSVQEEIQTGILAINVSNSSTVVSTTSFSIVRPYVLTFDYGNGYIVPKKIEDLYSRSFTQNTQQISQIIESIAKEENFWKPEDKIKITL